jgi:hypothetical protein
MNGKADRTKKMLLLNNRRMRAVKSVIEKQNLPDQMRDYWERVLRALEKKEEELQAFYYQYRKY